MHLTSTSYATSYASLRSIIKGLYESPFDESLFLKVANESCLILEAHYFSLYILSHAKNPSPIFLSNNPLSFIPVYLSVAQEDFLIRDLITNGEGCVLKRMTDYNVPANQNFIKAVQSERPISDVMYLPLRFSGILRGYFAVARAGLKNQMFNDSDLETFKFIVSFLGDAFARSLLPESTDDDIAYLDFQGNVLTSGARISNAFDEIFGKGSQQLGSEAGQRKSIFLSAYRHYLYGQFHVGMDRLRLSVRDRSNDFIFSIFKPGGFFLEQCGLPCCRARLLRPKAILEAPGGSQHALTPRELEVVRGIFQCKSNKAIALDLRIDESTVKRYTHNIYEKTGLKTRVELVMGFPLTTIDQL